MEEGPSGVMESRSEGGGRGRKEKGRKEGRKEKGRKEGRKEGAGSQAIKTKTHTSKWDKTYQNWLLRR